MKRAVLASVVLILTGCTTTLAPQAEAIKTTRDPKDVESCEVVGTVEAHPPYTYPGDDLKQLKNKALPLGADTIFVTGRSGTVLGVAYRCTK